MKKRILALLMTALMAITLMPSALATTIPSTEMDKSSGIQVTAATCPFTDVRSSDYFYDSVLWAVNHDPQITNGTSATTFSPYSTVTRGQAVTFLWRAEGKPSPDSSKNPFKDVSKNDYYYTAMLWAVSEGITNGTSSTTFSPNSGLTKGQMLTFLYRTMGEPGKTGSGAWYADAEKWAGNNDVLGATSSGYSTNSSCLRGDVVYYLRNTLKEYAWHLVDVEIETKDDSQTSVYTDTYTAWENTNTRAWTHIHKAVYSGTDGYQEGTFTATCEAPPTVFEADEQISLNVSIQASGNTGLCFTDYAMCKLESPDVHLGGTSGMRKFESKDGKSDFSVGTYDGATKSYSATVYNFVGKGNEGDRIGIFFCACGSDTRWIYEWKAD